jgi:hypothetical protein
MLNNIDNVVDMARRVHQVPATKQKLTLGRAGSREIKNTEGVMRPREPLFPVALSEILQVGFCVAVNLREENVKGLVQESEWPGRVNGSVARHTV